VVAGYILSLAIGLSLGLLGGGGSLLTVPVLHYVFGAVAHDAIAMSLVVVAITSAIALVPHARAGLVNWRLGAGFGVASMSAAFFGGRIGAAIPGSVLIVAFALVMFAAGGVMIVRTRRPVEPRGAGEVRMSRMLVSGVGVGLLTGILGAGGGFIIVPALTLSGIPIRVAIATSLFVIAANSIAALAGTVGHVTLDFALVVPITAIAAVGSLIGVWLGRRISVRALQRSFGWFVVVVGLAILVCELT
jgi:uncharacterized protein